MMLKFDVFSVICLSFGLFAPLDTACPVKRIVSNGVKRLKGKKSRNEFSHLTSFHLKREWVVRFKPASVTYRMLKNQSIRNPLIFCFERP